MDEDHRGSDDGDNVVTHDVKRRHRIVVDVIDVEVHLDRYGIKSTPLPGTPTVNKRCSAVHRGVSRDGRFIGGGARDQEPDGDTRRRDSDLDRFGPSDRHNTLCPVSVVDCIRYEMYVDVD